ACYTLCLPDALPIWDKRGKLLSPVPGPVRGTKRPKRDSGPEHSSGRRGLRFSGTGRTNAKGPVAGAAERSGTPVGSDRVRPGSLRPRSATLPGEFPGEGGRDRTVAGTPRDAIVRASAVKSCKHQQDRRAGSASRVSKSLVPPASLCPVPQSGRLSLCSQNRSVHYPASTETHSSSTIALRIRARASVPYTACSRRRSNARKNNTISLGCVTVSSADVVSTTATFSSKIHTPSPGHMVRTTSGGITPKDTFGSSVTPSSRSSCARITSTPPNRVLRAQNSTTNRKHWLLP